LVVIISLEKHTTFLIKREKHAMEQPELDLSNDADFDGEYYEPDLDKIRLTNQLQKIFDILKGGSWLRLDQIAHLTGIPEASASAHIRELRKEKRGSWEILTKRHEQMNGLFVYKLTGKHVRPKTRWDDIKRLRAENRVARMVFRDMIKCDPKKQFMGGDIATAGRAAIITMNQVGS